MQFEWNTEKAEANLKKHDISFDQAKTVFDDPDHLFEENRFITEITQESKS